MKRRAEIARRRLQCAGREWEYWVAGAGQPVVAFHGAVGGAETMEWFIESFAGRFRVIVPSLGECDDPAEVSSAVAAILDAEKIDRAAVFGISMGGLVAHALIDACPDRIDRVVLISCGGPRWTRAVYYVALQLLASVLPLVLVRGAVHLIFANHLVPRGSEAPTAVRRVLAQQRRRLIAYAREVSREFVRARIRLTAALHWRSRSRDLRHTTWRGRMLLLVAHDDPIVRERELVRIRRMVGDLHIHRFDGGGHLVPLYHAAEMSSVVHSFLAAGAEPRSDSSTP